MMNAKVLLWLAPLALWACGADPTSSSGFRLPDGDTEAGKAVFVQALCAECHSVEGTEFPDVGERAFDLRLGGKVNRVRTYGELVTAVINPTHDISKAYQKEVPGENAESPMQDFNSAMTVQELIDLVAFLQSTYTEYLPKDYDPYFP